MHPLLKIAFALLLVADAARIQVISRFVSPHGLNNSSCRG
jgi:hypothetical protein